MFFDRFMNRAQGMNHMRGDSHLKDNHNFSSWRGRGWERGVAIAAGLSAAKA